MRIFVTGASGFVGTVVVEELIKSGHEVVGVARSDKSAEVVKKLGATVYKGDLSDSKHLAEGARDCDGVIHCAFNHEFFSDFSKVPASLKADQDAAAAFLDVLEGTNKPFVLTSGIGALPSGVMNTEDSVCKDLHGLGARMVVEKTVLDGASRGVRTSVVRLPPTVHDKGDIGFIPMIMGLSAQKKLAGYAGDGSHTWPAVNRRDAARLFVLAVEKAPAGSMLHGIGEEAVQWRTIAEAIGEKIKVPVKSLNPEEFQAHFGWIAMIVGKDLMASSAKTQALLGWKPQGYTLVEDIKAYY